MIDPARKQWTLSLEHFPAERDRKIRGDGKTPRPASRPGRTRLRLSEIYQRDGSLASPAC